MMMLKRLLSLLPVLLVLLPAFAQKKTAAKVPTVEVYEIRKYAEGKVTWPRVILEISNPTDRTFYVEGGGITAPLHDIEAKRNGKWGQAIQIIDCGVGLQGIHALRPGLKMLVSVKMAWGEEASRYRFYFYQDQKGAGDVVSVRTRAIEMKELGEPRKMDDPYQIEGEFVELQTDEEINRKQAEERAKSLEYDRLQREKEEQKAKTPNGN